MALKALLLCLLSGFCQAERRDKREIITLEDDESETSSSAKQAMYNPEYFEGDISKYASRKS